MELFPVLKKTSCKHYWVWHNLKNAKGNFNNPTCAINFAINSGWLGRDQYYEIEGVLK